MRKLSEGGHWIDSAVFGQRDVKLSRSRLLGAITPIRVFQSEIVIHGLAESLLASEITFGGLNGCVSK
jgi:hypothetical protein